MNDAHSNVNSTSGRLRRGNERLNICLTPCVRTLLRRNVRAFRRSHHPPNGGSLSASNGGCERTASGWASSKRNTSASDGAPVLGLSGDEPTAAIHSEVAFRIRNWNYDVPTSPRL